MIHPHDLEVSKTVTEFALKHKDMLLKLETKSQSGINI